MNVKLTRDKKMRIYLESKDKKLTLNGDATLYTLRAENYDDYGLTVDLSATANINLSKLTPSFASKIQLKFLSPSANYKYFPDVDKSIVEIKKDGVLVATLPFDDITYKTTVIEFPDKKISLQVNEGKLSTIVNEIPATDITAPAFESATIDGNKLVVHYADTGSLDNKSVVLPASFSVLEGTTANPVTAVSIDSVAKTTTLTLTNAITSDQKFTVAYTHPTAVDDLGALQDVSGNDVATFAAQTVTNVTVYDTAAPVFSSANVVGNTLVMNYSDANLLNATTADKAAFTVMNAGVANSVTAVAVDAALKQIKLTLTTAVKPSQAVTVAYTDPTAANDANAIQDAIGNDAISLAPQPVMNNTIDSVAPVFASATVNGSFLVVSYTETDALSDAAPLGSAFSVKVGPTATAVDNPVTSVFVSPNAKTITLGLTNPILNAQVVSVAYTDPTVDNDVNAVQDASGNDALSLTVQTVTNATPIDILPPVFTTAVANGSEITLNFSDASLLSTTTVLKNATTNYFSNFAVFNDEIPDPVTAVAVNAVDKTVKLTLATPIQVGKGVRLTYTDDATKNDINAIQDSTGNDVATFSTSTLPVLPATTATMTNTTTTTPSDSIAPTLVSAVATGNSLLLTYNEAVTSTASFTVTSGGSANGVTNTVVDPTNKTIALVLANNVQNGQTVTISGGGIKDLAGNSAAAISTVTNNTLDITPPIYSTTVVHDDTVVITYNETLNKITTPASAVGVTPVVAEVVPVTTNLTTTAFTVKVDGIADVVTSAIADRDAKTVTLKLTKPIAYNESNITIAYAAPATVVSPISKLEDKYGNAAASFPELVLTNTTVIKSGKTTTALNGDDFARGAILQADGKILVGGSSEGNFALTRQNGVNGALDTTFDTDGKLTTNFGGNDEGQAIAVQSDGKILVAGTTQKYVGGVMTSDFALTRYDSVGALDTSFDTDGKVTTDIGTASIDSAYAMAIQPAVTPVAEKILIGGSSNGDFALARYLTTTGALDTTFDTDGKVTTDLGSTIDSISSIVVQSDGKIIAAGTSNGDFALVRYDSVGALDTTFDTDGKLTTDIGSSSVDAAYSVALQSDGKILVAGSSAGDFALVRYTSAGVLDTTFDTDGKVTTNINVISSVNTTDAAYKVLVQLDGKILVGGTSNGDFTLVRYDSTGALDTTFDTDGKLTLDVGTTTTDYAYSMALQSDGKIILTGTSEGTDGVDFALARYNSNGSLDTTFGL